MGRVCAWCRTVLAGNGASHRGVSHAICRGCLEELGAALAASGLRIRKGSAHGRREIASPPPGLG